MLNSLDKFVYNNKVFFKEITLENFVKDNHGLKKNYKNNGDFKNNFLFFLKIRTENNFLNRLDEKNDFFRKWQISDFNKKDKVLFENSIFKIIPKYNSALKRQLFNIFLLDALTTYKGWRHSRGLPVRGQRTWTNAWSSYKSNNILRKFKVSNAKSFYNGAPAKESNIAYSAEYVNMLWKIQWINEWFSAKISRFRFKGHPSSMKIDLYSMSNYQIMHPLKLKSLSKKKKQSFKKNYFSLGFDPGFTKLLLQNIFHTGDENPDYNLSKSSVVLRDERLRRKKK